MAQSVLFVYSSKDPAGTIMKDILKEEASTLPFSYDIMRVDVDIIYADEKDIESSGADIVVFLSRHSSQAGVPCLTCHTPGNFEKAEFGGKDRTLSIAPAWFFKPFIEFLIKNNPRPDYYQVCLEVTHHGPTPQLPSVFVEVGSTEKEWRDVEACRAVVLATLHALCNPASGPAAACIGDTHYARVFTNTLLKSKYLFGHIMPKYKIDFLDKDILKQMLEKCDPKAEVFVIEWKSFKSAERKRILDLIEGCGYRWIKRRETVETSKAH